MAKRLKTIEKLLLCNMKLNKIDKMSNLDDFINLIDFPNVDGRQKDLLLALKDLQSLIGLKELKEQILNQILFIIEDLVSKETFFNAVITGAPGTGKTTIIHILSRIYKSLGLLPSDKVIIADRTSLIAEFLGQTAIKTKKVLESARGGILLIDEVYSLGSNNNDIYSKECIDTINQFLSENVNDIICIVAGYEYEVNKYFFKYNSGLHRRFPWVMNIGIFKEKDLYEIFMKQLNGWKTDIEPDVILNHIKKNLKYFDGNGGDTRNLIDKCKINYARRSVNDDSKIIKLEDFEGALKLFVGQKKQKCEYCVEKKKDNCINCVKTTQPSHYI